MSGTLQPAPQATLPGPLASAPAGIPATGSTGSSMLDSLEANHNQMAAQASKAKEAARMSKLAVAEFDKLTQLGDTVSPDDVIQAASKMVASGGDPAALAGSLADMPANGGAALAAWVQQRDAMGRQQDQ